MRVGPVARGALAGMLRSFTVRRMRSAWLLVGCLTASVFVTSALVSALVGFYSSALPATVSDELAKSGAMSIVLSGETNGQVARQVAGVRRTLAAAFGTVPYRLYQATWSNDLALAGKRQALQRPVIQAAAVGAITANADLTAGSWPGSPQPGQPIPVALPTQAAADLGLRIGSVLTLRDLSTGAHVRLALTGLFRPKDPKALYWRVDPIGPSGVSVGAGFATYGPAVLNSSAFGGPDVSRSLLIAGQVSFAAIPPTASIPLGDLTALAGRITAAAAATVNAGVLTVSTAMPAVLTNVAEGAAAARSLVVISGLQLVLLAAAGLALASRLLAIHRDEESALLTARGAARWQLIKPSLAEAVVAVAAAAAAGVLVGSRLTVVLLSHLTGQPSRGSALTQGTWLVAAVLAALCLAIVLWPAARPPGIGEVRIRRGRQATVMSAAAAGADIALIVLALLAVRELRSYSAAAHAGAGSGIDPVIAIAPALAIAGLAIVPLRLLPMAARALERVTARSRRLGSAMANWEISRRPVRQSGPALLVILAVAMTTLALAQYQSWRRSVADQAAFSTGAQVRVNLAQPQPLSGVSHITKLPGVRSAVPVSQVPVTAGQLLVLGTRQAAETVALRHDLSPLPAPKLFRAISAGTSAGLALPGRPERLQISASMSGGAGPLGPVFATLTVRDAFGLAYSVSTSSMPADGKLHDLVAQLAPSAGAAYPLRLVGLSVTFAMPAYPKTVGAMLEDENASLLISRLSVSPAAKGPFPPAFSSGVSLASWHKATVDPGLTATLNGLGGGLNGATNTKILSSAAYQGGEQITFQTGYGPLLQGSSPGSVSRPNPGPGVLEVDIPVSPTPVPVIATNGYMAAEGLRLGSTLSVFIGGISIPCRIVAAVAGFPTGAALVADQSAFQDALASVGDGGTLPATSWWLATTRGGPPAGLPRGSVVTDAAAAAQALQRNVLSAAPVQAAGAVAAAAALLAALGFCVSVAASARARRAQRALLAALGVPTGTQARMFCLEEVMISLPASLFGLAVGIGLAHVLIPSITLTATAGLPVPPVLVTLPLGWVAGIALVVPAVPVVAAAIGTLRLPDPAAELRVAEAAG